MCVEPTNRCTSILHLYRSSSENYSLHFGLYFSIWNELLKFLMFFSISSSFLAFWLFRYWVIWYHICCCAALTHIFSIMFRALRHFCFCFFFVMVYSHERRKGGKRRSTKYMSSTYTDWMNKNCMRQLFGFYVMFCIHYMCVCLYFRFFCLYHNWSQLSSLNMNFLSYLISKYICLLWMIQYLIHIWQFKWGELWVECNLSSWFTLSISFLHLSLRFLIL